MRDISRGATPARHATQVHGVVASPVEAIIGEAEKQEVAEPAVAVTAEAIAPETPTSKAKQKLDPRSGHRIGWWVSMVGIGGVIGMLGVGYLKFIDGPAVGTATVNSLEAARAAAAPKKETPNLFSGLAVEFQYPSVYDTVGQVRTDARAIEQFNIGSKADYSRTIAVSVRELPSGTLDDDSSYRFRQIKKDEYRETNEKIGADTVAMMTKLDRTEQTLFWVHQGREVTVSITTNNPKDDVAETMKLIKSTLRWRK